MSVDWDATPRHLVSNDRVNYDPILLLLNLLKQLNRNRAISYLAEVGGLKFVDLNGLRRDQVNVTLSLIFRIRVLCRP